LAGWAEKDRHGDTVDPVSGHGTGAALGTGIGAVAPVVSENKDVSGRRLQPGRIVEGTRQQGAGDEMGGGLGETLAGKRCEGWGAVGADILEWDGDAIEMEDALAHLKRLARQGGNALKEEGTFGHPDRYNRTTSRKNLPGP